MTIPRIARKVLSTAIATLIILSLTLGLAGCSPVAKQQASTPPPAQTQPSAPSAPPATTPQAPPPSTVKGDLVVRFLDVGQGDSCFISLPDGTTMLIDAGAGAAGDSVVNYIKGLQVKKLDYVIFTHPHEDHIGGAVAVLQAFDVGQVYMPRTSHTTQTYEDLLNAIDSKKLTITEAEAGKVVINQENLKAVLIGPGATYEDLNETGQSSCR